MTTTTLAVGDFCVGNALTIQHTITGLPAPLTSAELGLKNHIGDTPAYKTYTITTASSASGQITDAGTLAGDGSYTAQVAFTLTGGATGDTRLQFHPGVTTYFYIEAYTNTALEYTSEVTPITPKVGGKYG